MGSDLLCNAGRFFSDHFVVKVKEEWEENCCVSQVEKFVIIMWQ
jgi:hypothetical protein